jgi:DNA-directed RNA polymerase subunit F
MTTNDTDLTPARLAELRSMASLMPDCKFHHSFTQMSHCVTTKADGCGSIVATCHDMTVRAQQYGAEYTAEFVAAWDRETCLAVVDEIARLRAENAALAKELQLWKPLTPAEAQAAFDEAEAMPLSDERIDEIVAFATDPAERLPNSQQAQLAAKVKRLQKTLQNRDCEIEQLTKRWSAERQAHAITVAENDAMAAALATIKTGEYDNAHDCKAAARIAADALAKRNA